MHLVELAALPELAAIVQAGQCVGRGGLRQVGEVLGREGHHAVMVQRAGRRHTVLAVV